MDVLSTINIICLFCDFVTERILGTNRERDIMTCRSIGADVFFGWRNNDNKEVGAEI